MQILKVTDEAFRQYGKVIKDLDVSDIITAMSEPSLMSRCITTGKLCVSQSKRTVCVTPRFLL